VRPHILNPGSFLYLVLLLVFANANLPAQEQSPVADPDASPEIKWGVGPWIWAPETHDKQTCRMWHAFDIPKGAQVESTRLCISVDNGYRLILNGRELGTGSDWRSITEYDISLLLKPGRHIVGVEAFNDNREAGMQFGLSIALKDGRKIELFSSPSWRIAPNSEEGWENRRTAPEHWDRAVNVSALIKRPNGWEMRVPTMTVKVPKLQPIHIPFWQSGWVQVLLICIAVIAMLACLHLMAKLSAQSKAQAMLQLERARIARDIHDELGARLTELALEGEVAQTELPADSEARPKFAAICEKARALSSAMDEVVWAVNPRRDTLRDFAAFTCKYAQRFLTQTPIRCRLDVEEDLPNISFALPVRRNLLLAVKEALNNAAKYSGAAELYLRIRRNSTGVQVTIEDNGKGFDTAHTDPTRNGITNMMERMKDIGGECRIVAKPDAGCSVEFHVPLSFSFKTPELSTS
jgi:signal transduction histidine kinase